MSTDAIRAAEDDAPTTDLVTGVVGDCCANCQAPLASDQRYCVNCGQRRGKARFAFGAAPQASPPQVEASGRPPQHRSRFSSGSTLVAGVATLLIAMGVGVLIGHDSNNNPVRASAPQVITIGGSAGAGTGAPSTAGTGAAAPVKKAAKTKGKVTTVHVTAKSNKAAAAAVSKVLGSGGNLSSNPTQQQGAKCTGGAGCQNGTFTGNFFGQ